MITHLTDEEMEGRSPSPDHTAQKKETGQI